MGAMLELTIYNTRTDQIVFRMVGNMSIVDETDNDLRCTIKTGENEFRTNHIHLNKDVMYIVENVRDKYEDPYHYETRYALKETIVERIGW